MPDGYPETKPFSLSTKKETAGKAIYKLHLPPVGMPCGLGKLSWLSRQLHGGVPYLTPVRSPTSVGHLQTWGKENVFLSVMVKSVFQLGWIAVPRYLVKRYVGCFCKGVFWMSLTFKLLDFEWCRMPSVMWMVFYIYLSIYINILVVLFLCRTLTDTPEGKSQIRN